MIRREVLKLAALALLPFKAVAEFFSPTDVPYPDWSAVPPPEWQLLEQHVGGWYCSARYRVYDDHIELQWYRMSLDKERFAPPATGEGL